MALDGVSPGDALLYDSSGGMIFTPGIGQTSGGVGGTKLFTNVDALGSVHDTQTNGDYPRDQARFEAFGTPVVRTGSDPLPLGFAGAAGYQTDSDTGLMLLGNRYYDASVGRFISPDPAKAGDNWYAYCGNNPLTHTDPTGLMAYGTDGSGHLNPGGNLDAMLSDITGNWVFDAEKKAPQKAAVQEAATFVFDPTPFGDALTALSSTSSNKWISIASTSFSAYLAGRTAVALYGAGTAQVSGGFQVFTTFTMGGDLVPIGAGMMLRGGAVVAGSAVSAASAMYLAGVAGWKIGTGIANSHLGPGGQTVTDYWANQTSGVGIWMQQHTSFGH